MFELNALASQTGNDVVLGISCLHVSMACDMKVPRAEEPLNDDISSTHNQTSQNIFEVRCTNVIRRLLCHDGGRESRL